MTARFSWRPKAAKYRNLFELSWQAHKPIRTDPIDPVAVSTIAQGKAALAHHGRDAARGYFAQAYAIDKRAIFLDWGLIRYLRRDGDAYYRGRLLRRKARWNSRDVPPQEAHVAALRLKEPMRAWAAKKGIPTPDLLGRFDRLSDVVWHDLPDNVVLKPTNAASSRGVVVAEDGFDRIANTPITPTLQAYAQASYAKLGLLNTPILIEEFVSEPGQSVVRDYKMFCVAGQVGVVQLIEQDGTAKRASMFDCTGRMLPELKHRVHAPVQDTPSPLLPTAIAFAERISKLIPYFLRIDLYLPPTGPLLGEVTTFPSAGLNCSALARRTFLQMWELYPDT